jgi:HSP20 family protein
MARRESKEIRKVEPVRALSRFGEIEKRFEELFRKQFFVFEPSWFSKLRAFHMEELSPTADIFESNGDVVIKAELPGIKKEDIDVKITGHTVTISGEKKEEEKVEKKDYYRVESLHGSFTRTLNLPSEVQTDKATAALKDGVLEIRIPKTEDAKRKEKKVLIE